MRDILFRGKAINRGTGYHRTEYKNGEWVHGLVTKLYDERFENLPAEMTDTSGVSGIEIDHKTICQYTGLADRNGKKIFEGDICLMPYIDPIFKSVWDCKELVEKSVIKYIDGCFYVEYLESDYKFTLQAAKHCIEIIGNIYDNPELLKEGATNDR